MCQRRGVAASAVDLRTGLNPIGDFAASGSSARSWNDIAPDFAGAVGKTADAGFRGPFAVADGRIIHNAGGSEAQELAFALASAIAYLRALEASGMALDAARRAIYFRLSADAEQFLTMAKFRALRKLWARVEQACGLTPRPVRISIAPAPHSSPTTTSVRGPKRPRSRVVAVTAVTITTAVSGRNASPVLTGE